MPACQPGCHGHVEVAAATDGGVWVRNSASPDVVLRFTISEWEAFTDGAVRGEFDEFGTLQMTGGGKRNDA